MLRGIADACQQTKRDSDIAARIGDEKFAVLLPETNIAAALIFAERLRRHIAESTCRADGMSFTVTVSIGIAEATLGMSGIEALLQRADDALLQAKHGGRNCVRVAGTKSEPKLVRAAE